MSRSIKIFGLLVLTTYISSSPTWAESGISRLTCEVNVQEVSRLSPSRGLYGYIPADRMTRETYVEEIVFEPALIAYEIAIDFDNATAQHRSRDAAGKENWSDWTEPYEAVVGPASIRLKQRLEFPMPEYMSQYGNSIWETSWEISRQDLTISRESRSFYANENPALVSFECLQKSSDKTRCWNERVLESQIYEVTKIFIESTSNGSGRCTLQEQQLLL